MSPRKVIGVAVAVIGIGVGGVTQGSDWQPDRLRYAVILAAYLAGVVGLVIWNPAPTARALR